MIGKIRSQAGHYFKAGGQGALAGWAGGCIYGGWLVFLGADLHHGFRRLASERLALATLSGALAGIALSLVLAGVLEILGRIGRRAFVLGASALTLLLLVLLGLVAFRWRQIAFPFYRFGTTILAISAFSAMSLCVAGLLAHRIWQAVRGGVRRAGAGFIALGGWSLALISSVVLLIAPRLPLPAGATGRSIILVSLDTLRADRLGVLGSARPLTPHLDFFAKEGVLFEQATAAAPWTIPSHSSLFSSLLPYTSHARDDTHFMSPAVATMAERLKNAGYRTGAFTGAGWMSSEWFGQGFDVYESHWEVNTGGAQPIVASALAWIRGVRKQPFFAFVHTYEPHVPYTHADFARPPSPLPRNIFGRKEIDAIWDGSLVLTPLQREYVADLYDGDVACADRMMGGMLETLRKDGILDSVVLVILSDHGEEFWEHDQKHSPEHGHTLYQEILHVPLIVRAPGLVQPGVRLKTPVSLLDVLPTLEDLTGLGISPEEQGRSLRDSLTTGREPDPAPIYSESTLFGPDRFALRRGDFKVILTPTPKTPKKLRGFEVRPLEIFDLSQDPREERDLSAVPPAAAKVLTGELWNRIRSVAASPGSRAPGESLSPELREQLRSLGYIR